MIPAAIAAAALVVVDATAWSVAALRMRRTPAISPEAANLRRRLRETPFGGQR